MSQKTLQTISMSLSTDSINEAIRQVKQFKKDLVSMCEDLARKLVSDGIEIAQMQVVSMEAVFNDELEQSIQGVYFSEEHCGVIYTDCPHALFVEYGTGYKGKKGNYPGQYPEGYTPDQTGHGERGWWYPAEWGWWIPKKGKHAGEKMAWTQGMPPRPFMLNTLRWLEEIAAKEGINMFRNNG